MREELVSYETAMLAKDKGFPQPNLKGFNLDVYSSHDDTGEIELNGGEWASTECAAPTQSQLQTWLRNNEYANLFVVAGDNRYYVIDNISNLSLSSLGTMLSVLNWSSFDTYEKALEFGLKQALTLMSDVK